MIYEDEYFLHYLLSLFDHCRPLKAAQCIHVFQGRRTPTMLYLIETQHLYSSFELLPKLSRRQLEKCFQVLEENKWIKEKDDGFVLTLSGKTTVRDFFKNVQYPDEIKTIRHVRTRRTFWERFQLFTQVFSQFRFNNSTYTPVIKHPSHQEGVRKWFAEQKESKNILTDQWIKESFLLFELLPEEVADMLAFQLAGYHKVGQTKQQTASYMKQQPYEFLLFFENALEQMVLQVEKSEFSLLKRLLNEIKRETSYGLSSSTYLTAKKLGEGLSIEQVSTLRRLKVNTIREHILEIAFIQPAFVFKRFIPEKTYHTLHNAFENNSKLTYQESKKLSSETEFMHYRLVELERLRRDESNH